MISRDLCMYIVLCIPYIPNFDNFQWANPVELGRYLILIPPNVCIGGNIYSTHMHFTTFWAVFCTFAVRFI